MNVHKILVRLGIRIDLLPEAQYLRNRKELPTQ